MGPLDATRRSSHAAPAAAATPSAPPPPPPPAPAPAELSLAVDRVQLSPAQTEVLRRRLGLVTAAPPTPPERSAAAPEDRPAAAPAPLRLGQSLTAAGLIGPEARQAYRRATAAAFGAHPTTSAQAHRMVMARGIERLALRGASVGLTTYASYEAARTHLERGDRARAAAEMIPAAVQVGVNARLFLRDREKYGHLLGAMASPRARAELVVQMLQQSGSAARTSDAETVLFRKLGAGLAHAGLLVDLSQLASDGPAMTAELQAMEKEAEARGDWGCREALGGLLRVCGPREK